MSIKSFFIPDNALQGEGIPSYVLWKDINYDGIEVYKPSFCEVEDIYNVEADNYKIIENKIIINKVEVEGYLGVLFKSNRTSQLLIECEFEFVFLKNNEIVEKVNGKVILFTPELEIKFIPSSIYIKDGRIEEKNKIFLENVGEGTCRIIFKNTDDSEIEIKSPKRIREFIDGFTNTFDEEIDRIKEKYENFEYVFEDIKYLVKNVFDPSDENLLKEFDIKINRLEEAFELNEKLSKDVMRIYILSLFKNLSMLTVMEQFLDYIKSIEKNRVVLQNALDSITICETERILELEIYYTDLLNTKIKPIKLSPIKIISNKELDISIFNLFCWEGESE